MSWTLCTSAAAVAKAGTHCNAVSGAATTMAKWSDEAEGKIEQETHTAWVDNYSSLSTGIKNQLSSVCSSIVAMDIISFDPTGYLSREADMLMNKNYDIIITGLKDLENKNKHTLSEP
jgi:hypothetical protein